MSHPGATPVDCEAKVWPGPGKSILLLIDMILKEHSKEALLTSIRAAGLERKVPIQCHHPFLGLSYGSVQR